MQNKKETIYDTATGEILSTHSVPLENYPACYMVDKDSQIVYVNAKGIHKIIPDGNLTQTVIDDPGYAYADPNITLIGSILNDSKSGDYFLTCIANEKLRIYRYSLDKELPTNPTNKLFVWAIEDNEVVRAAASIFAQEYPECEVTLEFGKTNENNSMTHEDIVRSLNTRLLAGDAPDVLFLDGLSIDTLSSKGLLGEMNIEINQADYYENILNSFQRDGKTVAYPAFFQMPVLCSSEPATDLPLKNSLDEIAKLYENDKLIFNNSYKDVFDAFFYSSYSELFPDNKSVNETAIKKFLTATKNITNSQKITSEISPWGEIGMDNGGGGAITTQFAPSLMRFSGGHTRYATGILKNLSEAATLFKKQNTVVLTPLLSGNYLCKHIASIPTNAENKEMAQHYIRILLSNDSVQLNNVVGGFSVKKGIELSKYNVSKQSGQNAEQSFLSDPTKYDWDALIGSFNKPCNSEFDLYNIVYEQAKKLYSNETNVNTAAAEIMKKLKIFLAEKS